MKLRKILCWGLGATLGTLAVVALGGYCWLYSWSWGDAPVSHASFTPVELTLLQGYDSYISKQAPLLQYEYFEQEMLMNRAAGAALDDDSETAEPQLNRKEELLLPLVAARISRQSLAPLRRNLHKIIETGSAEGSEPYLAVLALQKKDVPLVRLLVEKGAPLKATKDGNTICLLEQTTCASDLQGIFMPIAERIALMDWLVTRGADISEMTEEDVLLLSEASIKASDDAAGAIMDWFLRRGYALDKTRAVAILLQYAGTTFPTFQKLIEDGLLPEAPQELETAWGRRTPLQLVAGAREPAPDMLRWLLSMGHNPNTLPETEESSQSPLDACLSGMLYLSLGQGKAEDARLRGKLEVLDILLQHGARPGEQTRGLLPVNAALEREIVDLFRKHGFHITAGENPYNACCVPE